MAGTVDVQWPVEHIPDEHRLFMRVHRDFYDFDDGRPLPVAFRDQGGAMSTDWEKYATARDTRDRGRIPQDNAVVSLVKGGVCTINGLSVVHSPDYANHNRAHTDVHGSKKAPGVRLTLSQICKVEIQL